MPTCLCTTCTIIRKGQQALCGPARALRMAAPAEKLHNEPGAVQFIYNTSYVALGGGLALGGSGGGGNGAAAAAPPPVWEERPQTAEPAKLPPPLEDLDDFISLEDAAPAAQVSDPPCATDSNRLAAALPRKCMQLPLLWFDNAFHGVHDCTPTMLPPNVSLCRRERRNQRQQLEQHRQQRRAAQ